MTTIEERFLGASVSNPNLRLPPDSLAAALLYGRDDDMVQLPGAAYQIRLGELRGILRNGGWDPRRFAELNSGRQNAITHKIRRLIERTLREQHPDRWREMGGDLDEERAKERARVFHQILVPWSRGPLTMERPQSSSLHHLIEYDVKHTAGGFARVAKEDSLQSIVVENDWARALSSHPEIASGRVPMPFPSCAWEMRVSGVRVIALIVTDQQDRQEMILVYGAQRHWVLDDYSYDVTEGRLVPRDISTHGGPPVKFERPCVLAMRQARAACVLLDLQAARAEQVRAPTKLVQRARAESRAVPRDHVVVRWTPRPDGGRRAARSAGGGPRAPQRGHLRRGTWVHYDDPDSGSVQYANDGGFVVSKTWRRWHWAGDMNNMIDREYRL